MARTMLLCPLCLERGCAVSLVAELEAEDNPARAIVTDVQGGCEHARQFGELDGPTLIQMWAVIEAVLDAANNSLARGAKDADALRCAKCRGPIGPDTPRIRASDLGSYHLKCYAKGIPVRRPGRTS